MKFEGFISGSYQSRSLTADNQRCVNLYPEALESGSGKSRVVLYRTPGLQFLHTPGLARAANLRVKRQGFRGGRPDLL